MRVMVGLYCNSYDRPPASVTLDIDDTLDVVHGHQQLSMFNAHYVYKSALELSDSVRCNERQSAIMMVRRCMADLKPGVFDAPLRGYRA